MAKKIPSYREHTPTHQALVTLPIGKGKFRRTVTCYLGEFGTKASREKYDRLIAEWLAIKAEYKDTETSEQIKKQLSRIRKSSKNSKASDDAITVEDAAKLYFAWASKRYAPGEATCVKGMLEVATQEFKFEKAENIGPAELRQIRSAMLARDWSRSYINAQLVRVRRWFRWLAAQPLIPAGVVVALSMVNGLRAGEDGARETEAILPVSDEAVEATLAELGSVVADMVRIQLLTGMRPAEVCMMRVCDIDHSGAEWVYVPQKHKTQHHGKSRSVLIGERGQDILRPYLVRAAESYCFSPRESAENHHAERNENRTTPVSCGNTPGSNRKAKPQRKPGESFTSSVYGQAIARACKRAGVKKWSPNQLRHAFATKIRAQFGLEHAQVTLGHSRADVTQMYAERDMTKAIEVARRIG